MWIGFFAEACRGHFLNPMLGKASLQVKPPRILAGRKSHVYRNQPRLAQLQYRILTCFKNHLLLSSAAASQIVGC